MSINLPTGDPEAHLARRIVELRPGDFRLHGKRNLWTNEEQPPDGAIGVAGFFVDLTTTRNPGSNTASYREHDLQVLARVDNARGKSERAKVLKVMRDLYDALHRCGEWTDEVDGARYVEVLALDSPINLQDRHISLNVTMRRDG
jgi:hypothetical protein